MTSQEKIECHYFSPKKPVAMILFFVVLKFLFFTRALYFLVILTTKQNSYSTSSLDFLENFLYIAYMLSF